MTTNKYSRVRHISSTMIVASTIVLVCCTCYLLSAEGVARHSGLIMNSNQSTQLTEGKSRTDLQFHLVAAGESMLRGIDVSFRSYRSSDGVELLSLTRTPASVESARQELQKVVEKATKLIERGLKRNCDGEVIGERVVILFSDGTKADKEIAAVWWTREKDLLGIECASLDHILAFENKNCR